MLQPCRPMLLEHTRLLVSFMPVFYKSRYTLNTLCRAMLLERVGLLDQATEDFTRILEVSLCMSICSPHIHMSACIHPGHHCMHASLANMNLALLDLHHVHCASCTVLAHTGAVGCTYGSPW